MRTAPAHGTTVCKRAEIVFDNLHQQVCVNGPPVLGVLLWVDLATTCHKGILDVLVVIELRRTLLSVRATYRQTDRQDAELSSSLSANSEEPTANQPTRMLTAVRRERAGTHHSNGS